MNANTISATTEILKDQQVLIYGCGQLGKLVYNFLTQRGIAPTAFIDKNWQTIGAFGEISVISPDILESEHAHDLIILAIFNPYTPTGPIINNLRGRGIKNVWTMIDFVSAFPEGQFSHYWLAPKEYVRSQRESYNQLSALLADERSKQLVENIYAFRSTGDNALLPSPDSQEYLPSDIPRWRNPMRLIDCGAFTGDTIQGLMAGGYTIDEAIAFEPDPDNFNLLATALPDINVINIPCGVAMDQSQLYFEDGMGMGSRLNPSGNKLVQCVSISKLAPNFAPTLIKMDVEGAEIQALRGAEDVIRKYRPGLAISIYHEADHLWKIPLMLKEWNLGYTFHIRIHEENTFGTVLYALHDS